MSDADRSYFFVALVVVDALAGLADAVSGPYVVLFLIDQAGVDPLHLSMILTARALSGIAFATALGAWVDRQRRILPLGLALLGSAVGYGLLASTTNFLVLLLIAAGPIALSAAAFSQSVALVKQQFEGANLYTASRALGVLRASWSLAWAIGPAVGAAIVGAFGFRGVFLTSAALSAIALAALILVRARPTRARSPAVPRKTLPNGGLALALAFSAIAVFHTALFMGSIPLAIVLTGPLGGAKSDVGLAFSLCAALEIVVMGVLIWRPLKHGERLAIIVGFAAFTAYFLAMALAHSVTAVLWAQVLRAVAIGLVTYLGISFLQSLLPHRAGAAAALFSNAAQLGSVASALSVGAVAQASGWSSVFTVCGTLCMVGLLLVWLVDAKQAKME